MYSLKYRAVNILGGNMEEILAFIEKKKCEFSLLPFFEYLRDQSISPKQRLAFAPCAAPFIMSFGELNRTVFRDEPTSDPIQEIINKHTYEDEVHWLWFLEDLEKLGLNPSEPLTDTLKFLWSEKTSASRHLAYELYRCTVCAAPLQKLVVIMVIEATGNTVLQVSSQIIHEIQALARQEYRYFGDTHLVVDSEHYCIEQGRGVIESIQLTEQERKESYELIERIFMLFINFVDELLTYSRPQHLSQGFPKSISYGTQYFKSHEDKLALDNATTLANLIDNHIVKYDYLIIGAGPAGLQLGYFLEKISHKYLILETGKSPGTFFKQFPRHKKLISINKKYTGYDDPEINLRWDWNSLISDSEKMRFTNYSKDYFPSTDKLVEYFCDFATNFDLNIKYNCEVVKISKKDKEFSVTDGEGNFYSSSRLIIATGLSKPYLPNIPGIELTENYVNVSVDPEDFVNQKVLIIGKGNSGFETADNLMSSASLIHIVSPNPVSLSWKTKYVGHLRAVNNNFIDSYQLKSQNIILNAFIEKIERKDGKLIVTFKYTHANGELEDLSYDRVIACTGFQFDSSIFDDSCRPELAINNRFPRQTSEWESTNVRDLFFAGTLTHMRDFKKKQSGFIHGFRYNIRALHHILEHKYYGQALPYLYVNNSPEALTDHVLKRVNVSSGLWQQTGFLCDLAVVPDAGKDIRYYEDIPVDYVHDGDLGQNEHYYIVTLEFGLDIIFSSPDPLAINRVHKDDVDNADLSPGLHPIVRRFCSDTLLSEHHVIEDIASEWLESVHIQPLVKFFQDNFSMRSKPLGIHLFEAGLISLKQLEIALKEQKTTSMCLEEIFSNHGWMKKRTIEYMMEKVVHKQLSGSGKKLGSYLVEADLVTLDQIKTALDEQKKSTLCLGEILNSHGWVNRQTIEYMMDKIVLPERQISIASIVGES
jgi:thioredoxin reductase